MKTKRLLTSAGHFGLMLITASALFIAKDCLSAYREPDKEMIECPTATNQLGLVMPAYKRTEQAGIYIITHCDGSMRKDTVKFVKPLNIEK